MSTLTQDVREYRMLIGGESLDSETGQRFESVRPYTGAVWATVMTCSTAEWRSAALLTRADGSVLASPTCCALSWR